MTKEDLEQITQLIREENEPLKSGKVHIKSNLANVKNDMAIKSDNIR